MSHIIYEPVKQRLQRSELAVPGSSPKMFEKALQSSADYVFLDLEDAVAPDDKIPARQNVIDAIIDLDWKGSGKTISVRINSIDTHYMYQDVVEVVEQAGSKLDTILLPKAGTASDVYMLSAMLNQIETAKVLSLVLMMRHFLWLRVQSMRDQADILVEGILKKLLNPLNCPSRFILITEKLIVQGSREELYQDLK